jgi:hypothetical protein
VQMSAKEEEEEMLVKIGADTQTFVSGSSWESWGSRGRLMFSDIHPSILIFDSIYIHAVCICVVFFRGVVYIYAIEMFSLSNDEQWSSSLGFFILWPVWLPESLL